MDEATTTELLASDHKRDQVGRKLTSATERAALLAEYRHSGLTQRAFAERAGIKYSTFTSWLQGVRGARATVATPTDAAAPVRFVEASVPALFGGVEVTLPDGTKVRGSSGREVAELIKSLRS